MYPGHRQGLPPRPGRAAAWAQPGHSLPRGYGEGRWGEPWSGAPPRPSPGETAQDPSAPGVLHAILSTHWVATSADTPSAGLGQKEAWKLETEAQQGCSSGAWGAAGSPAAPRASHGVALRLRPSHKGWSHWIQA